MFASILRRLGWPQFDTIGPHRIRLPRNNRTLEHKRRFRRYDTALGTIARIVHGKYPDLHAIDIGANVGDTAALMCKFTDIPVLCVEGDARVLPTLRQNARRLGQRIEIDPHFVGLDGQSLDPDLIQEAGHNAAVLGALRDNGPVKLRSLDTMLRDHPAFAGAKLLKTDTEGCDFDILRQSIGFIRRSRPVLFFEYDPSLKPSEPEAGLRTIETLAGAGYTAFVYFDNFGNPLLHADAEQRNVFTDLDQYLKSNRRYGTAVYYFDICAFHAEDFALSLSLKECPSFEACETVHD
jgi:FkbM family methyltransferase